MDVARRHGMNRSLLWNWRHEARKRGADGKRTFVPIRVVDEARRWVRGARHCLRGVNDFTAADLGWHPECMVAKGKAHKRYEFGVKVSVATTNREGLVLGMMALPGNPYDGHTLTAALDQVERMTGVAVARGYVDRGYRGHGLDPRRVFVAGQRRSVTPTIHRELRRRSAIEPVIGHMKTDGRLDRNFLAGVRGDAINALLCGAGYNLRLILNHL
jgi:Transposase DDE domain